MLDKGLAVRLVRERKPDSPRLLPESCDLSFPANLIDDKTIVFIGAPIPYELFWHGAKHKSLQKDRRKLREVESRLDELFDWLSFEKDVTPNIGPQTALWLQMPSKPIGELYLPYVNAILKLSPSIEFEKSVEKVWKFAMQNSEVSRNVKKTVHNLEDIRAYQIIFQQGPLSHLVSPTYTFTPQGLFVSSQPEGVKSMIAALKSAQEIRTANLFVYLNFPRLAAVLRSNLPFFEKEAKKKGEPFEAEKARLILEFLAYFQQAVVVLRSGENREYLEATVEIAK
jgi:hypothetical protein